MASNGFNVPIIDMHESEELPEKIVKAFEEWGCFRILNHGIPMALMSEMKVVARSLLDLPVEIKLRNANPVHGKGYTPPNLASPFFEGMTVYDMASNGAVDGFCDQLGASPHQREILTKYSRALYDLAQDLGGKLMEGMGLVGKLYEGWPCQFRLNKYNYSPQSVGLTGAIMHSDPGFLTILQDDEVVGGLEAVKKGTDKFVPMEPMPGSLVVNVGDIAKVWSNGRFCNVKHRVQCYQAAIRISVALFILGPRDSKIEAPKELVDSEHPRLYVPFDFEEYRTLRTTLRAPTGGALESYSVTKSS
ncbi:hypothetical protein LguiB_009446 [Lonicera macranthoides]